MNNLLFTLWSQGEARRLDPPLNTICLQNWAESEKRKSLNGNVVSWILSCLRCCGIHHGIIYYILCYLSFKYYICFCEHNATTRRQICTLREPLNQRNIKIYYTFTCVYVPVAFRFFCEISVMQTLVSVTVVTCDFKRDSCGFKSIRRIIYLLCYLLAINIQCVKDSAISEKQKR